MKLPFASMFREWRELARFQSLEPSARSIVFYAEDGGSWGHFAEIIESLTGTFGRQICYITSSPEDPVLERSNVRILPFYIGSGSARTQMFRTLNAEVMVMTMPDIETFHIKRSRHPVHYAYVHHSMISTHMAYRPDAFDHFDSVLCVGPYHEEEIRSRESVFGLKAKTLVAHGYGRLDAILRDRAGIGSPQPDVAAGKRRVLIAPSWGEYALLESCGVRLIEILSEADYHVTVRPHPMTLKSSSKVIRELTRRFGDDPKIEFEFDMASAKTLHASDIMVSDWSGAALEFAFGLERPVLFVDVPKEFRLSSYIVEKTI
ncbi:MAG: CDP-glycerol glycerophosphotransferase family protein [Chloroflexi bacterium]|nr:CDP-glycerol glycerophosphotransferase family protein [Chloroflexota bacterium]